jgi:hypothetical protein
MKRLALSLLFLSVATVLVLSQQSKESNATPKPDGGSFAQNTYKNDFFSFSYPLPREWHKSTVAAAPLPPGAFYLFIGDRNTGQFLVNRVMVIADAESNYRSGLSEDEYISAIIRAQVTHAKAQVIREPASFLVGKWHFYRADYKRPEGGATIYNSLVCTKRKGYFLSWNFVSPSERELGEALNMLQHISFGQK